MQFASGLGHELAASMAVVGALFAGIALGSLALAPAAQRSARPGLWFAGLEALIGAWGLLLAALLPIALPWAAAAQGERPTALDQALWSFLLPMVVLLPSTLAMGATLPAVYRQASLVVDDSVASGQTRDQLGLLYAANTGGAVFGVLATVFLLAPALGLQATAAVTGLANLLCAGIALWFWRGKPTRHRAGDVGTGVVRDGFKPPVQRDAPAGKGKPWALLVPASLMAATGLLGIGYETLCIRVISQVTENTVYSYAVVLAVFLLATAAGAALPEVVGPAQSAPQPPAAHDSGKAHAQAPVFWLLTCATALALGVACLWLLADLGGTAGGSVGGSAGTAAGSALGSEVFAALLVMGAPGMAMGALFAASCRWAASAGLSLGGSLACNTAGAALAPALVGAWLIPQFGSGVAGILMVSGYGLAAALLAVVARRGPTAGAAVPVLAWLGLVLLQTSSPLRVVQLLPGETLRHYVEGVMASVSITEDREGILRLRINNRAQEGSSAPGPIETRLALLPALLHPQPRTALLLGMGTGHTAAVAALDGRMAVDVVELLPEVAQAADEFRLLPQSAKPAQRPSVVVSDARRFVQAGTGQYDLIIADLFHPARSGASSLYTAEHFRAVGRRLAPGGVVCQWLALHQMELRTMRPIVAAFLQAFPDAVLVLAANSLETPVIGLMARPGVAFPGPAALRDRLEGLAPEVREWAQSARLVDEWSVLGSVASLPAALRLWVKDVDANTDDRAVVAYSAPWDTYAPTSSPRRRLERLISDLGDPSVAGAGPVLQHLSAAESGILNSYWLARRRYLGLGLGVASMGSAFRSSADLEHPLQELLDLSPQFTPAADALRTLRPAQPLATPLNSRYP